MDIHLTLTPAQEEFMELVSWNAGRTPVAVLEYVMRDAMFLAAAEILNTPGMLEQYPQFLAAANAVYAYGPTPPKVGE